MNSMVLFVSRILLATLFLVAGFNKLSGVDRTIAYLAKQGVPAPNVMVWAVIAAELGGGLLLVLGWKTRWVAWFMAAFTLAAAFIGHAFWNFEAQQATLQMTQFLKNLAIVGGFLLLASAGPGRVSLDRR